jgi:hypothetical protein
VPPPAGEGCGDLWKRILLISKKHLAGSLACVDSFSEVKFARFNVYPPHLTSPRRCLDSNKDKKHSDGTSPSPGRCSLLAPASCKMR